jgi:hypothetical protein
MAAAATNARVRDSLSIMNGTDGIVYCCCGSMLLATTGQKPVRRDHEENGKSKQETSSDRTPYAPAGWCRWDGGANRKWAQRRDIFAADPSENAAADSIVAFLRGRGIWSGRSEGRTYYQINEPMLMSRFERFVTAPTREYLRIEVQEQTRPTGGDGSEFLSRPDLIERLVRTDRWLAENPNAVGRQTIEQRYRRYLSAYLSGWDNTSVFNDRTRVLDARARVSYQQYVARYPSTTSGRLVAEYLALLRANGYRRTAAVTEFLSKRVFLH